jgi:hypothetical protein
MADREVLVVRGRLDRAGRFTPRKGRSTGLVRQWPVIESSDIEVELLDRSGRVLHREPADVSPDVGCQSGDPQRFRVVAYIELRPDATVVRLMRHDLELWRDEIPPRPTLQIALERARPSRRTPAVLRFRYSRGGPQSHLTIVYKWGTRRFRPIYIGRPSERVEIDLADMPGGEKCRFVASYSNGMRSAQAASREFPLPRLGPRVAIARPEPRATVTAGVPVILEGSVRDDERPGGAAHEALVWMVGDRQVGQGLITSVDGLTEGRHTIRLVYRGTPGAEASRTLRAQRSKTPTAADWPEWDPIDGNN